jgi:outer membrane lipoprotein-sorting protein
MKILTTVFITAILAMAASPARAITGEEVIAAMHKKYDGKWYKTLTFVQTTTTYKPDGTSEAATWYEVLSMPGKLRIDIAPIENNNGVIYTDGKIFQFRDGKTPGGRAFVHPLLVVGFDVYMQPVETTVAQLKSIGIDLSVVSETKWQERDVYVVGAKAGDLSVPQFWVDKKDLLFRKLIQLAGPDQKVVRETQFNRYEKAGGGWVAVEVKFFTDGKMTMLEEYRDVRANPKLDPQIFDPEKFTTVEKNYWRSGRL